MLKNSKIKILILLLSIIIIGGYFFISLLIGNDKFKNLKLLLNVEQRQLIKKYIFPYKLISQQQQTISHLQQTMSQQQQTLSQHLLNLELLMIKEGSEITLEDSIVKLSNNKTLKKYNLTSGFYTGINELFPGSVILTFIKVI